MDENPLRQADAHGIRPRRVILDVEGNPLCVHCFVQAALECRVAPWVLERLAGRYTAPQRPMRAFQGHDGDVDPDVEELVEMLSPYSRKIYNEGPLGNDRSAAMFKLAAKVAEEGAMGPDDCFRLLQSAAWSKYTGRADEERRLQDIIDRVFA